MMKRLIAGFIALIMVLSFSIALSEEQTIRLIYGQNNKKIKMQFGCSPTEICTAVGNTSLSSFRKSKVPYWHDPSLETNESVGYYIELEHWNAFFYGKQMDNIVLYCLCQFDNNGPIDDLSSSQLYLAKMNLSSENMTEKVWKSFINDLDKIFGKCKKSQTSSDYTYSSTIQIGSFYSKQESVVTVYHKVYTWNGLNNTGMKIYADFASDSKMYSNIVIYLGRTNMDSLLKKGRTSSDNSQNGLHVISKKKTITLRDSDNKIITRIESGTPLLITGYDATMKMFTAIVLDDNGNASFEGYVSGDGLSVDRATLLKEFKE